MSCNKELYDNEELACRDTFLKDAKTAGFDYYFYKATNPEHPEEGIDEETRTMYINARDDYSGTSKKTLSAIQNALGLEYDWDYIIKTNVSTWLNIEKIVEAVDTWPGRDDLNIYGARFIVNHLSKQVPFPRGHFVILSRRLAEGISEWMPKFIVREDLPKTDDTLIGLTLLYYIVKILGEPYQEHLLEVPSVICWYGDSICDAPEIDSALSVRCKDEVVHENTPGNMRKVHEMMHGDNREKKFCRPFTFVETKYGAMGYDVYLKILRVIEMKKRLENGKQDK